MSDILGAISKKAFKEHEPTAVDRTIWLDEYVSTHERLHAVEDGGALFLVTARPGDVLWLVAILEHPRFEEDRWVATKNAVPIRDVTDAIPALEFHDGQGLRPKPGGLGRALSTPRVLTEQDAATLRRIAAEKPTVTPKDVPECSEPQAPVAPQCKDILQALEHMKAGAPVAALEALVRAWGTARTRSVADQIEALSNRLAPKLSSIPGRGAKLSTAWLECADHVRAVDVPRLVRAFERATAAQLAEWFEVLERFAPDPRLSGPVLARAASFTSTGARPTRSAALRLIERIGDPAVRSDLEAIVNNPDRDRAWLTEFYRRAARVMRGLPVAPELGHEDALRIQEISERIREWDLQPKLTEPDILAASNQPCEIDRGTGLLDAVWADPQDDGARLVFGDWQLTRGDPRGEFIALQFKAAREGLTAKEAKEQRELLRAHLPTWLGPLAPVVKDPVFERGFLDRCRVEMRTPSHHELVDDPHWATVRSCRCSYVPLLASPAMKSLKTIGGLSARALGTWARHSLDPIRVEEAEWMTLSLGSGRLDPDNDAESWRSVVEVGALENLQRLSLKPANGDAPTEPSDYAWLLESKLGGQLTSFGLDLRAGRARLKPWLDALEGMPKLARLLIRSEGLDALSGPAAGDLIVCREHAESSGSGFRLQAVLSKRAFTPSGQLRPWHRDWLVQALMGVPQARLASIQLTGRAKLTKRDRERYQVVAEELASRFGRVEVLPAAPPHPSE